MTRISSLVWAAVAVLGLNSPVFSDPGSFGGFAKMGGARQGQSSQTNNRSGNLSVNRLPSNGGKSVQVFNNGPFGSGGNKGPKMGGIVKSPGKFGTSPTFSVIDMGTGDGVKKPPIKIGPFKPVLDPKKPPIFNPPGGGVLDPFPGGKPPKKPPFNPFPGGGIPPVLDPGGKPPIKPPFPGGGNPPVIDPGNGGGGNGGGNGGGHGPGNGHGHGCYHGGGKHCWPHYCLNWYWPTYYTQPYCGTVYVNGCWTYSNQPVSVAQISLLSVGNSLPEIPSNATFKLQVAGLGAQKGIAAVEINGVGMQAELLEWNADSVVVRLPAVGLTQAAVSQLHILQSDGSMAKTLDFKMLPAMETAVASTN